MGLLFWHGVGVWANLCMEKLLHYGGLITYMHRKWNLKHTPEIRFCLGFLAKCWWTKMWDLRTALCVYLGYVFYDLSIFYTWCLPTVNFFLRCWAVLHIPWGRNTRPSASPKTYATINPRHILSNFPSTPLFTFFVSLRQVCNVLIPHIIPYQRSIFLYSSSSSWPQTTSFYLRINALQLNPWSKVPWLTLRCRSAAG